MRKYLVIINMGKDYKIPLELEAKDNIEACCKASKWCKDEDFYLIGMEIIEIHDSFGIVRI